MLVCFVDKNIKNNSQILCLHILTLHTRILQNLLYMKQDQIIQEIILKK